MVRFQSSEPKRPKVQTHLIAFVPVEEKSIGVIVTLRREHCEGVVYAGQKVRLFCFLL